MVVVVVVVVVVEVVVVVVQVLVSRRLVHNCLRQLPVDYPLRLTACRSRTRHGELLLPSPRLLRLGTTTTTTATTSA